MPMRPCHHTDTVRHVVDTGHPCPCVAIDPMAEHLHLEGTRPDHPAWMAEERDDVFDAAALERAMVESRQAAYAALRELAPAS